MEQLQSAIQAVIQKVYNLETTVVLTRPDEQFGDYATNVALQIAKQVGSNPREIAETLAVKIRENCKSSVKSVEIAGPGFINITLTDAFLLKLVNRRVDHVTPYGSVLLEYSCPNAFKELHTGHLYQTIIGDAIGKILEGTGSKVFRANFGGDVGLHVAKCLYGMLQEFGGPEPGRLAAVGTESRPEWVSSMYVKGAAAYEDNEAAKAEIATINTQIYGFHQNDDHDSPLAQIYWTCREWSYDYFKTFYEQMAVAPFDKYYPESTTSEPGLALVRKNIGTVFDESDGAIVLNGDKSGLHTRVFITSKGLPTYETKDLGVIVTEAADFSYDQRVIITGNDQTEYMKVVFAALSEIDAELGAKQKHFVNGTVRFGSGQKMSSRLGNVTRAIDVLNTVSETVQAQNPAGDYRQTALAAIKYSFLKHRLGGDIAFDITESVSLEGNSGPYLQYAHARARSILAKAEGKSISTPTDLQADERTLLRKLTEYHEVVTRSATEFMPHYICTYLYELCQEFNRFYEKNRVIGDPREAERLQLVTRYADTLKHGLELLGIHAPDRM